MESELNTIVIGAGQAGLATSYWLSKRGLSHLVLERGRVGQSWRSQRWDSFHLNTPNGFTLLPGDSYQGDAPDGFSAVAWLIEYFDRFQRAHQIPVEEGVEVTAVRRVGDGFQVETEQGTRACRNLVLCSGDQSRPILPAIRAQLPERWVQMHAADYRRPDQLPEGATLVVGSGQSGVQIAEDLVEAGRRVFLCTSSVGRVPRRYRGKDVLTWMKMVGLTEQRPEELEDPNEVKARQPQASGTHGGHSVSLHGLARQGVTLLGRLEGVEGGVLRLGGDLQANADKGDASSRRLRGGIDLFIEKAGIAAPPAVPDEADRPFEGLSEMAAVRQLDLAAAGIGSVIWSTGFGASFGYLDPSFVDERGLPRHHHGVCDVPGLYCVGLVWMRRRSSGLVAGVDADAEFITGEIAKRSP